MNNDNHDSHIYRPDNSKIPPIAGKVPNAVTVTGIPAILPQDVIDNIEFYIGKASLTRCMTYNPNVLGWTGMKCPASVICVQKNGIVKITTSYRNTTKTTKENKP